MWWAPQEEALQQEAEAAWAEFPAAMPGLPDIAVEMGDAEEEEEEEEFGDQPFEAADAGEDAPPPIFQWHQPEGAPEPGPAAGLVNGFHMADLLPNGLNGNPLPNGFNGNHGDFLAVAMGPAWDPFDVPPAEDDLPG